MTTLNEADLVDIKMALLKEANQLEAMELMHDGQAYLDTLHERQKNNKALIEKIEKIQRENTQK